jgi:hypothetical protein
MAGPSILLYLSKMTNRCVKELVNLLMYSKFTPCFGKWLPSSGVVGSLEATQAMSVLWPHTPITQTLLE